MYVSNPLYRSTGFIVLPMKIHQNRLAILAQGKTGYRPTGKIYAGQLTLADIINSHNAIGATAGNIVSPRIKSGDGIGGVRHFLDRFVLVTRFSVENTYTGVQAPS